MRLRATLLKSFPLVFVKMTPFSQVIYSLSCEEILNEIKKMFTRALSFSLANIFSLFLTFMGSWF